MQLATSDLQPFLRPNPLKAAQKTLVDAWAPVLALLLTKRYGEALDAEPEIEPVFHAAAASAVQRRLDKSNSMVASQSVGNASVSYSASLLAWFAPEELAELDEISGKPVGIRSVRAAVDPATWLPNRHRSCAGEADDAV